jgi:uncharacterized protein YcfJ
MKLKKLILTSALATLLSGCAGVSPTRVAADGIGAAGGALLGHTFGKGNPLFAAAGAGAGVLLGESLQSGSSRANEKSYAAGYEKGRSDSAKQQYKLLVEQQRQPANTDAENVSLFDVPLPERNVDGAILKPSTATLRIQE